MESRRKSFWDYLRAVIITIMVIIVGILVIIAIWYRATPKELAYLIGLLIGFGIGFITRGCLRKNK